MTPTRAALTPHALTVIENVPGAPLRGDFLLCGSMFGLEVRRHRYFELSTRVASLDPMACNHSRRAVGVYGHPRGNATWGRGTGAEWIVAMGIDWMTEGELAQAIPPVYTEFIGRQLLAALTAAA